MREQWADSQGRPTDAEAAFLIATSVRLAKECGEITSKHQGESKSK
jgi:hypothetical protein